MNKFILLILIVLSFSLKGEGVLLNIDEIVLKCSPDPDCGSFITILEEFEPGQYDQKKLHDLSKRITHSDIVESFYYEVRKDGSKSLLLLDIILKREIRLIKVVSDKEINSTNLLNFFPYKEGEIYEKSKHEDALKTIRKFLEDKGFDGSKVEIVYNTKEKFVDILVKVQLGSAVTVEDVRLLYTGKNLGNTYKDISKRLLKFKGKPWDRLSFKVALSDLSKSLFDEGFFQSKLIELKPLRKANKVILGVELKLGKRYGFSFRGNVIFSRAEILENIRSLAKSNVNKLKDTILTKTIEQIYETRGVYHNRIKVREVPAISKSGVEFKNFFVDIKEGQKIKVESIRFFGNSFFTEYKLKQLFQRKGSALSKRGFLDNAYLKNFIKLAKSMYIDNGFIFIDISGPKLNFDEQKKNVKIHYEIREKQQTYLESVNITGIEPDLQDEIRRHLINKNKAPININFLEEDLQTAIDMVRSKGFYFARFKTLESSKIVRYSDNYNKASINIDINVEKKSIFEGALITGNSKTKTNILKRELHLKKGDILTPENISQIKFRLTSLGLFSTIKITPIVTNKYDNTDVYHINLLVHVREKDFGIIEIAPGYRTDLGAKLSTTVTYNNISGKNRSVSLKTQANHRLTDFSNLDNRRRLDENKIVEFFAKLDYTEPYLFGAEIESRTSLSYKRKKFFSFDADIIRFSPQISKQLTESFSTSLKYQLEKIRQYDATDVTKDNGVFTVGGLTASFALDFRDSRVLPKRGAYFGFSAEFANPFFLSTAAGEGDNEVDFMKIISRNKYYIPLIIENWTVATSLALGYQKNLGPDFIPSIKVFRLDGVDAVRGFADDEINRLEIQGNPDISSVEIDNSAYFANFKLEPRYDLNDNMVLGLFFDAGRVFTNHFKPLALRTSVGASFKFKTPVGTLDFDYGFKMRRKDIAADQRERVGRFHLSIGFF